SAGVLGARSTFASPRARGRPCAAASSPRQRKSRGGAAPAAAGGGRDSAGAWAAGVLAGGACRGMAGFAGSDASAVDDFGNAGEDGLADSEDIGADGAVGGATADLADGAAGCGAASGGSSSTKKSS
ncbi:MAG: hypothetical protein KBO60_18465, partial [Achromobacter sp.]|nr:hypothetical protein [Achromobacter sp.]